MAIGHVRAEWRTFVLIMATDKARAAAARCRAVPRVVTALFGRWGHVKPRSDPPRHAAKCAETAARTPLKGTLRELPGRRLLRALIYLVAGHAPGGLLCFPAAGGPSQSLPWGG